MMFYVAIDDVRELHDGHVCLPRVSSAIELI